MKRPVFWSGFGICALIIGAGFAIYGIRGLLNDDESDSNGTTETSADSSLLSDQITVILQVNDSDKPVYDQIETEDQIYVCMVAEAERIEPSAGWCSPPLAVGTKSEEDDAMWLAVQIAPENLQSVVPYILGDHNVFLFFGCGGVGQLLSCHEDPAKLHVVLIK